MKMFLKLFIIYIIFTIIVIRLNSIIFFCLFLLPTLCTLIPNTYVILSPWSSSILWHFYSSLWVIVFSRANKTVIQICGDHTIFVILTVSYCHLINHWLDNLLIFYVTHWTCIYCNKLHFGFWAELQVSYISIFRM